MGRYTCLAGGALALMLSGCVYVQQMRQAMQSGLGPGGTSQLACQGDFIRLKNGFPYTRPMQLNFAVYWTSETPAIIPLEDGAPAQVLSVTPLELSFLVQYRGYKATYRLNRVDGSFTQRPNFGGVFSGACEFEPLVTRV